MKTGSRNTKVICVAILCCVLAMPSACGSAGQTRVVYGEKEDSEEAGEHTMDAGKESEAADPSPEELIENAREYFAEKKDRLNLPTESYAPSKETIDYFLEVIDYQPRRQEWQYDGTARELVEIIKRNTAESAVETGDDIFQSSYGADVEEALTRAIQAWMKTAENATYDDYNTIKDATICLKDYGEYGTYAKTEQADRVVILYRWSIEQSAEYEEVSLTEELTYQLMHELNHLRQSLSDKEKIAGKSIYSFDYETTEKKSTFITEASAESELYAYGKVRRKQHTYPEEREAEAELMLFGLLSEGKSKTDYYNAVFNNDLGALFDFWGMDDMDDLCDLYQYWYAVDATLERNTYVEKAYESHPGLLNMERDIGSAHKELLFLLFTEKLLDYMERHEGFSWKDNLLLFTLAKNAALNDSLDAEAFDYDRALEERLKGYEEYYTTFLSTYYNAKEEDIRRYAENVVPSVIRNMNVLSDVPGFEISLTGIKKSVAFLAKYPLLRVILMGDSLAEPDGLRY